MTWSRGEALTDPAIREPISFLSEFKFFLRDIPTEITFRLYRPIHSGRVIVRASHTIEIPDLNSGERGECDSTDQEGEALHQAVDQMVCIYNAARAKGLTPDPSWLKPNDNI